MKQGYMKRVALILIVIFGAAYGYAQEYKIVLLSYSKFEEARKGLNALEPKLDESYHKLQSQYRYEIVARPSGRAFLIGIEPIEGRENADRIREKFSPLFPKSYIDKYYGPTEGSVFMVHAAAAVAAATEENETASPSVETIPAVTPKAVTANKVPVAVAEESTGVWILIVLAVIIATVLYLRKGKGELKPPAGIEEENLSVVREIPEEETISETIEQAPLETTPDAGSKTHSLEEKGEDTVSQTPLSAEAQGDVGIQKDSFDKLKSNMFFMLLVNELKTASENREHEQCRDIIAEMQRYEKNGPKSTVVQTMSELVEMKKFTRLLAFIEAKMKEGEES
ncbi:MAG: hypothetical protein M0P91_14535 [Sulfuricurvum sp.]|jgi:hypothetical protein|uniref:hypothetical protein n=1 Tax=Sulfuricurvum sp. TaxID=2025608 RepID=UPI0025E952BF|nr:hypothetical protein [Sulfuricurvum sp.]MCK9374395.1 hypothetical protein [Sulfuricurvum sp.]